MKHVKNRVSLCAAAVSCLLFLSSCVHSRRIAYFNDLEDTTRIYTQDLIRKYRVLIQPGDILDIYVNSLNSQASAVFNLGNVSQSPIVQQGTAAGQGVVPGADSGSGSVRGYEVEPDGSIDFPVLGKMMVAGESTDALRDSIKSRLNDYLKVPVVNVRFLNYKITILGEVAHPATYTINGERATIIDLLGMAGDLTIYGRRDNIMVVREDGHKRTFARLDLTSSRIFNSPYYFLKQNDVVYVEPSRARVVASDDKVLRNITIAGTLLGLAISVILLFKL
jgi:polysaccharide export outer membrane protein